MDITPYVGTIVTVIIAVGSVYAGFSARIAKLETLIGELEKKIDKHNQIVERTYKLEADAATALRRHDELAERVDRLEDKL
ncbi:MAG: hypothetical protein IKE55_09340 [Kiritimatiellae bacterium]|nr:hypothetical protein [Kiritimatiellia bacterium]